MTELHNYNDTDKDEDKIDTITNLTQNYEIERDQESTNFNETQRISQQLVNEEEHNEVQHETGKKMSEQNSRESMDKEQLLQKQISKESTSPQHIPSGNFVNVESEHNIPNQENLKESTEMYQDQEPEEQEYVAESVQPNCTDENYQNYDQNYEPNYQQPEYTEQYENYEQYAEQYADPNAQYNQYEIYPDGYTEQTYDNSQYNQEYTTEYPQTVEPETTNEKLASQS